MPWNSKSIIYGGILHARERNRERIDKCRGKLCLVSMQILCHFFFVFALMDSAFKLNNELNMLVNCQKNAFRQQQMWNDFNGILIM